MPYLYKFALGASEKNIPSLESGEIASVLYHNIFDYPLTTPEVMRWTVGEKGMKEVSKLGDITQKDGYYFLTGKEGIVYKRLLRERVSARKIDIAKKSANLLGRIPWIKGIFLTGALSMENASEEGDIDFLLITKKGTLWRTRLLSYLTLSILGIKRRKPNDKNQKDKLCLNIWLDENDLAWDKKDRNIYTAHEIAQVVPIINKDDIYEKFLSKNDWVLAYWPNSVRIMKEKEKKQSTQENESYLEKIAFLLQYKYMEQKMTRERVTLTKAIFHPNDWGKVILQRLAT